MADEPAVISTLPRADVRRERRWSWAWLLPIIALIAAGALAWSSMSQRGITITVQLPEGHGLQAGDSVRYRGIDVGEVMDVNLTASHDKVLVHLRLRPDAESLATTGARFWVVRPQLRFNGVEGLETLVGPHYMALLPGEGDAGEPQRVFDGLAQPPMVESVEPGDLEVVLEADRRGSLRPGAPLTFRQVQVGTVMSVGLASDGSIIEARIHIPRQYRPLVRAETKFWDAGGVAVDLGLSGMSVEMDSIAELFAGGVAMATPPLEDAGDAVHTGRRFALHDEADDDWLEWRTDIALGSSLLPPGCPAPHPLRVTLAWRQGMILTSDRSRHGWVLPVDGGLLGPADLLTAVEKADEDSVTIEVGGRIMALDEAPIALAHSVAVLSAPIDSAPWRSDRFRRPTELEDAIVIGDSAADPLPLAISRMTMEDGLWRVDRSLPFDESWHGAVVAARSDGRIIGVLLIDDDDEAVVAPVPEW